jgi:hypothetical protein
MLEAAKAEGHLTWNGRRSARLALTSGLKIRLKTLETIRRFPEILAEPVRRPIIVVGAPRTGTTLMNHLLALDPEARPLMMWEGMAPTPWKYRRDGRGDPRPKIANYTIPLSKRIVPELAIVHDFGPDVPDECQWLFWPTFVWPACIVLPSYRAWLLAQPESLYDRVYAEYRRALQMLHWQRPATGHWVLKSPLHAWAIPSLLRSVPEARVVQTHRHLREVIPSFCSLGSVLCTIYTDAIEPQKVGPHAMTYTHDAVDRIMKSRDEIDPARHCDVNFAQLVKDPIGTVRTIYDKFGHTVTPEYEERIRRFLAEKPAASRPKHVYSMEQFGLDGEAIDREFETYHRRFGLEKA